MHHLSNVYSRIHSYVAWGLGSSPSAAENCSQGEATTAALPEDTKEDTTLPVKSLVDHISEQIKGLEFLSPEDQELEEKKIVQVLNKCEDDTIFNQRDSSGYSLLQHVAHLGSLRLAAVLLAKGAHVDGPSSVDSGPFCSPPLHLACQGGHVDLSRLLLNTRARTDLSAPTCYPHHQHMVQTSACNRFPLTGLLVSLARSGGVSASNSCPGESHLPVHTILLKDAAELLDIYLQPQHRSWIGVYSLQQMFSDACRLGAEQCARLCIDRFPLMTNSSSGTPPDTAANSTAIFTSFVSEDVAGLSLDQLDESGYSPFLYSVASCSYDLVSLFISMGANPLQESRNNETALHVLFKYLTRLDHIYERVKLLLGNGLESAINHADSDGQTVLHCIASHVNNNYRYLSALNEWSLKTDVVSNVPPAEFEVQAHYQKQILDCLKLVLSQNCAPHIKDNVGYTPLGLLMNTFSSFLSNDVDPNFASPLSYLYVFHMDILASALELFYTNGCSPSDNDCPPGVPHQFPVKRLLHGILNISPVQYHLFRAGYIDCLRVLLKHGACCNFTLQNNQGTCVSLVAALAESVLSTVGVSGFGYSREAKEANCVFIDDILRLLLDYGLQPNYRAKRGRPFLQGGQGNALCEFVHLTRIITDLNDLRFIHTWVLTLLQYGADPSLEPYPAEPTILHSQSSIFLRHQRTQPFNQLLHYLRENSYRLLSSALSHRLLSLLADCTDPSIVAACLQELRSRLESQEPASPLLGLLRDLHEDAALPPLKRLARFKIWRQINGRLQTNTIGQLNIPRELERYILYMEH